MGNFQLKIDVEPNDIPSLDDSHKQDCAYAINRVINSTFKYTMIFAITTIGVYAAYTLFGLVYVLRMGVGLPTISPFIPMLAVFIIIFELIAGTMKRWALILEIILHIALAVFSVTQIPSLPALPFAVYGIFLHLKLITLIPHYEVISNLRGFPDFTPLPIGDVVKKADGEGKVSLTKEPEAPKEEASSAAEKPEAAKDEAADSATEKPEAAKDEADSAVEEPEAPKEETSSNKEEPETTKEAADPAVEEPKAAKEEADSASEKPEAVKEETNSSGNEANPTRKSNSSSRKKRKRKRSSK